MLGSGDVGQRFATGLLALGHEVRLAAREATNAKIIAWRDAAGSDRASVGTFAEATAFATIIFVATLGSATLEALEAAGHASFDGKIVVDATNPLVFPGEGKPPALYVGWSDSLGEQVQRALPKARVVKAFNTTGSHTFVKPRFAEGVRGDMMIAGNDAEAKTWVTALLDDWGWGAVDLGGIEGARLTEPMCIAWVIHGFRSGAWGHGWKLLHGAT